MRARDGDLSAEQQLFSHLLVRFTLLAKRRVGTEDARDIAQDACLTVLQKMRAGEAPDHFDAWSYSILRMRIGNYYQKNRVRQRVLPDEVALRQVEQMASVGANPEQLRHLLSCVRKIIVKFPRYARVLNLVHQGYTTAEICRRLNIKPGNLYVVLNRGRRMLSDCLNAGGAE